MAIRYKYKGQFVELVPGQQFSSHWNVYYNEPVADGGTRRKIVTAIPGDTLEIVDDEKPSPTNDKSQESDISDNPLDINTASFLAIKKHFPGIGRTAPRKIIDNRPEGGYKDFDHLKELNSELTINWDELKDSFVFQ